MKSKNKKAKKGSVKILLSKKKNKTIAANISNIPIYIGPITTKKIENRQISHVQLSLHHRRPASLGGSNNPKNLTMIDRKTHNAWHTLFNNLPAPKIAEQLQLWGYDVVCVQIKKLTKKQIKAEEEKGESHPIKEEMTQKQKAA